MKYKFSFLKAVCLTACVLMAGRFAKAADQSLSASARKNMEDQIRALNQEKQNRTPAQKKMDSHLVHAAKEKRKEAIAAGIPKYNSGVKVQGDGTVLVDIEARFSKNLLNLIAKKGGKIVNRFEEYDSIRAFVPVEQLEFFAGLPEVRFIRTATEPETHAISQGDRTHRADFVKSFKNVFGTSTKISGQGIKVGVLSDSVDYLSNAQTSNTKGRGADLGPVTIITDGSGNPQHGRPGTGEGTAMLEIVYDLAPGAQLFFATGNGGKANMANNIRRLRNVYGCDIIIDDLTYADEPPFQDDLLSQAVYDVSDSGALYFSSAANSGNQDDGTSATWEGDFNGGSFIPGVGTYHRWSGTNILNSYSQGGTNGTRIQLFWSDKLGQSDNDYDLYVFDNAGNVLAASTLAQTGSEDPYEWVGGATNGLNMAVLMVNAQNRYLHLDAGRGRLQFGTSGDTRGHNASSAGNAFCVAASPVSRSPAPGFFTGGTENPVETFSSDGLRLRFYDRYTNAFTPGDFSSTGGFAFQKPDITAADGVANSGVYPASVNLSPFYGTSAAAPHAGAIAALLKSYNTNLTDVQIRQCLLLTALDIEAPGNDRDSGFGLIRADLALAMAQPTIYRSATNLSFSAAQGAGNPASQTFNIKNTGFTKLNWSVASSQPWLGATPTSGDATKGIDTDVVTVSVDVSGLSVGIHTATLTISDPEASNTGETISVYLNISDTTAPTLRITSPLDHSAHQNVPALSGVASDGGGSGIQNNRVEFTLYQNGDFWTGTQWKSNTDAQDPEVLLFAPIVNGVWNYTSIPSGPNSRAGTYFVSSYVRDLSGNLSPPEPGVTSISFEVDRDPPNVAITSPLDHAVLTNSVFPGLSGTASDSIGLLGVNVYLYRFSDGQFWDGTAWGGGGSAILPVTIYGDGSWNNTGPLPVLGGANPSTAFSNGDYNLIAIAFDAAGNEKRADSIFTVDFHPVYTWTAGSFSDADPYNNNNFWDNPANWDLGTVPIPDATVIINSGSPDNLSMGIVNLYGMTMTGGSLTTSNMVIQKFNFSGGQISDALITIPANGIFNISGSADKTFFGTVVSNNGTANWSGTGRIFGRYGTAFNNYGVFHVEGDSELYNNSGGNPSPVFNNYGTFEKAVATNATVVSAVNGGWVFNQFGTLDIQSGMLSFQGLANFQNGSIFSGAGSTVISSGTTTIFGTNILNGGNVELAAGSFTGTGVFAGNGTFHWSGGTVDGNPTIAAGANFAIQGSTDKTLAGMITNAGNANWTGTGLIYCRYGGVFYNSGSFAALNDSQFYNNTGGNPTPVFVNTGTFTKSTGTNTTTFANQNGGVAFSNQGQIIVQSGVLSLAGSGSSSHGSFETAAGTRVDLMGGVHDWTGAMDFTGNGVTRVAGFVHLNNCTNTISAEATIEVASGKLDGTGDLTGSGTVAWTGGNLSGILNVTSNLTMEISGVNNKILEAGTLNNAGTIVWTGVGQILGSAGSLLNNTGVFEMQNDSQFYNYTGGSPTPIFNNAGTLRKTVATGQSVVSIANGGWILNNTGTIDVQSGVLSSQSQINLNTGGQFSGAGKTRVDGGISTMNGSNSIVAGGTFEFANGNLNGTGTFNGSGSFIWSGGIIDGNGGIGTDGNMFISGDGGKTLTGTFTNAGAAFWTGAGNVNCSANSIFVNSGIFTAQNGAQFFNYTGGTPAPRFKNSGTFIKNGVTNATEFALANSGVAFDNTGLISAQTGVLLLNGGGASSNATFAAEAGARVELSGGTHSVNGGLTFLGAGVTRLSGSTIDLSGGTNTIAAGATFEVASGILAGNASFAGPGNFAWTGGTIAASLNLLPNLTLNMSGNSDKFLGGGILNNAGTLVWTGVGSLNASAGSALNNSGSFNIQNDAQFFNNSGGSPNPILNNTGVLRKTVASGLTIVQPGNGGWTFNNTGVIDIQSGVLSSRSAFNLNAGGSFSGTGVTRIEGDTAILNGANALLAGGTVELANGTLTGTGTFSGSGTLAWSGGILAGNVGLGSSANFFINGNASHSFVGTLNNSGTTVWTNDATINCAAGSTFNNSGTFVAQGNGQFYNNTGGSPNPVFNNSGTFRKTSSTGATTFSSGNSGVSFLETGTVDLQTGTLSIAGEYSCTNSSLLKISLGGLTPATEFAQELFSANVPFAGALQVGLVNGFVPTNGASFEIVKYPSHTGQFSSVALPVLSSDLQWNVVYGTSALTLSVEKAHSISSFAKLPTGEFQMNFSGPAGGSAILQASTELITWTSLTTNSPFNGNIVFTDASASTNAYRFYRVLIWP